MKGGTKLSLKFLREKRGLSQAELAKLTGISVRTIQSYESKNGRNINRASLYILLLFSKVLRCSLIDLIDDPELIKLIHATKIK